MRVAIAQMNTHTGALSETCERMLAYACRAQEGDADLVIYPAPTLTGLMALSDATIDDFLGDLFTALQALAEKLPIPALIPVVVQKDEELLQEAMFLRKGHVTPLRLAAEIAHLSALTRGSLTDAAAKMMGFGDLGFDLPCFEMQDLSIGVAFTYQELNAWRDTDQSADILLYLSSLGYVLHDKNTAMGLHAENSRFVSDANELGTWIVAANPVGLYGTHVYIGSSFVMTPDGWLTSCGKAFEEDLIFSDLSKPSDADKSVAESSVTDTSVTDVFATGASVSAADEPANKAHQETLNTYDTTDVAWKALQLGLTQAVIQGGFEGVAVLLDNSLNAHVVEALAKSVLSEKQVYIQRSHAHGRLEKNVEYARLAAVACEKNLLVLATENKTDIALNPSGVHATSSLYILGDFYLSEVRDLVESASLDGETEFQEAPSMVSELDGDMTPFADKTERDTFVDHVLTQMLEGNKSVRSLLLSVEHPKVAERVCEAFQKNTFARQSMRPILTFSKHSIVEESFPLFSMWRDTRASEVPRQDTSTLFDGLRSSAEHTFSNSVPEQMEAPSPESVQEILEYLREFSGLEGAGVMFGVPKMWRGPFSEN